MDAAAWCIFVFKEAKITLLIYNTVNTRPKSARTHQLRWFQ